MEANVRSQVRDYIVSTWLSGDSRGFDDETDLQRAGVLDSFAMLDLTAFIGTAFKVQLEPTDINAETFRSVNSVVALVLEKLPRKADGSSP
jgi:acyl carrier protein